MNVGEYQVRARDDALRSDVKDVLEAVGRGDYPRGILVCGTGAGMAITANKVPGVRAVPVMDPYTAERAMASNNAQIITFFLQNWLFNCSCFQQ